MADLQGAEAQASAAATYANPGGPSAAGPDDVGGGVPDVAAMAKARLEQAIQGGPRPPRELLPDPLAVQAQMILSQAAARGQAEQQQQQLAAQAEDDIFSKLPPSHKQLLRGFYADPMTGEAQPYFIGTLKSYSSKSGYGFLACSRAFQYWGVDVFVHKNQVPVPWHLGQPVEFAAIANNRGQPQAADCFWLPQLPQQQQQRQQQQQHRGFQMQQQMQQGYGGGAAAAAVGQPGMPRSFGSQAPPSQAPASPVAFTPKMEAGAEEVVERPRNFAEDGPFYLGTLKSFSSSQGYGFLQCDDVFKIYQRDIYFDRLQLPRPPIYTTGQTIEFAVNQNNRGQPQARNCLWDCIPLCPSNPKQEQAAIPLNDKAGSKHSPQSLEKLRKLLRLLNDGDKEAAVVTAIDYQGATVDKSRTDVEEGQMPDIDFVTYVLDRLGNEHQAATKIKDFVKMLLLLMIAKMLRKRFDAARVTKLSRWLTLLASTIDPTSEKQCQEHFLDVVSQIENNLRMALDENPTLQEATLSQSINKVLEELRAKANNFSPQPAA